MKNNVDSPQQSSPGEPLRLSRDFVLHVGKLPELARGEMVWILVGEHWHAGQVGRRLPGQVYWCKLSTPVGGCRNFILHCGNFGGKW
jgi:hypothetical protein